MPTRIRKQREQMFIKEPPLYERHERYRRVRRMLRLGYLKSEIARREHMPIDLIEDIERRGVGERL